MKGSINTVIAPVAACLLVIWVVACTSVQEAPKAPAPAVAQKTEPTKQEKPKSEQPAKQAAEKSSTKQGSKKAVEVEGVISSVGQRTITFQVERKGKVREEVVGVDDKTNIEKQGSKVKLKDLQQTDKALINYEPEAYTPALAIKVIGTGKIQKVGGDD